jgi:hypothetical protein
MVAGTMVAIHAGRGNGRSRLGYSDRPAFKVLREQETIGAIPGSGIAPIDH